MTNEPDIVIRLSRQQQEALEHAIKFHHDHFRAAAFPRIWDAIKAKGYDLTLRTIVFEPGA